jgi:hypothetical protein
MRKTTKRNVRTAGVMTAVDPAKKKRYDALVAEIAASDLDEMRGWDRKYEAVGTIIDERLYLLSDHGTAKQWVEAVLGEGYRQAMRNIRVARYCSPEDEHTYTPTKLDAAITYLEARTHGPVKGRLPVKLASLHIPVTRNGHERSVPLDDATVPEILAAAKGATSTGKKPARRSPAEHAFAANIASDKRFKAVTVRVADGSVTFGRIPLGDLSAFLSLVRAVDWQAAAGTDAAPAKRANNAPTRKR